MLAIRLSECRSELYSKIVSSSFVVDKEVLLRFNRLLLFSPVSNLFPNEPYSFTCYRLYTTLIVTNALKQHI